MEKRVEGYWRAKLAVSRLRQLDSYISRVVIVMGKVEDGGEVVVGGKARGYGRRSRLPR